MATALVPATPISAQNLEAVLVKGDLAALTAAERLAYYRAVCESVGLNPLTQPFAYIQLNGKLTLYAKRDATDQLRSINNISITIAAREVTEGCYVVTARAKSPAGREDESIGAVSIEGLKGEARSNALMKAETKAKRRVTLGICGLAFLDESEVSSVKGAVPMTFSGSTEAAQEVAQAKIAEMRRPAPIVAIAEAAPEAEDGDDSPYELIDEEPSELEEQLRASIEMVARRKAGSSLMMEAFADLKKRYQAIGMEKTYYGILGLNGVAHSADFERSEEGLADARCAYRQMNLDIVNRERAMR